MTTEQEKMPSVVWGDRARGIQYISRDIVDGLVEALGEVLNSDMAMREEDEGETSSTLDAVRAALATYTAAVGGK